MAKTSRRKGPAPSPLVQPEKRRIDFTKFKPDLAPDDLKALLTPVRLRDLVSIVFPTIETISPTKTVGIGRTNLTLARPTLFQTDTVPGAAPFASFDSAIGSAVQRPTVSVHFEPARYGFTGPASFIMEFAIEVNGTTTFEVGGFAGSGTLTGTGSRTLSGQQIVSIGFRNVPLTQQVFGHVFQTGNGTWRWFRTRLLHLPLVLSPA